MAVRLLHVNIKKAMSGLTAHAVNQAHENLSFFVAEMPPHMQQKYDRMCRRAMHTQDAAAAMEHEANAVLQEMRQAYDSKQHVNDALRSKYASLSARHANMNLEAQKQLWDAELYLHHCKIAQT